MPGAEAKPLPVLQYSEGELLKDAVAGSGKDGTWQKVEVRSGACSSAMHAPALSLLAPKVLSPEP